MSAFSEFKQKALAFYQGKTESEQKLLLALGAFLIIFVLVSSIKGLNEAHQESNKKLEQQVELNNWASQQIAIIESASSGGGSSAQNTSSLTQIVNSTARRHRVTLARIQPQSTHMVKLGLDEVNFNQVLAWLAELRNQHGIVVNNIDISEAKTAGLVKVRRLDLERK